MALRNTVPCLVCREPNPPHKHRVCEACFWRMVAELGECQACKANPAGDHPPLCNLCYETPRVRNQFSGVEKAAKKAPLPPQRMAAALAVSGGATSAQPGTEEKILVLAQRYERRVSLFHPKDPVVVPKASAIPFSLRPLALLLGAPDFLGDD